MISDRTATYTLWGLPGDMSLEIRREHLIEAGVEDPNPEEIGRLFRCHCTETIVTKNTFKHEEGLA